MPRQSAFTTDELLERALQQFWKHGFHATSMDALVKSTGVSRHGIYATFGGKNQLFHACFGQYQNTIVTPAFGRVEEPNADLTAIADYFETQISLSDEIGLPGPGCFVVNSSTEVAPHDAVTQTKVAEHNLRLFEGFRNALINEQRKSLSAHQIDVSALAEVFVVFSNGLWSLSRTTRDADVLRAAVKTFLNTMEANLK